MYEVRKALVFGAFVVAFVMISSATLVPQTTSAQVVKTINKLKETEKLANVLTSTLIMGLPAGGVILGIILAVLATITWPITGILTGLLLEAAWFAVCNAPPGNLLLFALTCIPMFILGFILAPLVAFGFGYTLLNPPPI